MDGGESPVTGVIAGNHRQIVSPVTGVIAGRLTENCITGKTPLSRHGPTGDCPGWEAERQSVPSFAAQPFPRFTFTVG